MRPLPPALHISRLHKHFGSNTALDGIDLSLPKGQVLALLGPSGCGKTTLLRCIAGLTTVDEGSIELAGDCVARPGLQMTPEQRRLGMVFQDYALWPHLSVQDNVSFPLEMLGVSRSERRRRVRDVLALVGLADFAERQPGSLSGGQQQRVALARAIVSEPRLLLMDEPLSNLDKSLRESLALDIRRLIDDLGLTAVFVTHDQHEAFALADQIAVLQAGRLQQITSPEALYHGPATPDIARFLDAGSLIRAHSDGHQLWIGQQPLPLSLDDDYQGEVTLLLPRQGLTLTDSQQAMLTGRLSGSLFQGEHYALRVRLTDGSEIKLNTRHALPYGTRVGLDLDVSSLVGWHPDGSPLAISVRQATSRTAAL